jgi:hypothetical protein
MRNRSIRGLYVLAASVAVSSALGLAGATAASAGVHVKPSSTTVCDNNARDSRSPACTDISSLFFNNDNAPSLVQNATMKGLKPGSGEFRNRIVNLRQHSDSRPNEDFNIQLVGFTDQLCGAGGAQALDPTSFACLNYPNYPVYEGNFTPLNRDSGYCVGALAPSDGFKARLLRCGTPKTFWVADLAGTIQVTFPGGHRALFYFPLELASDTSATHPEVLTLNPNSKNPVNQLTVNQENFQGGKAIDRQLFTLTQPVDIVITGGGAA